MSRLLCCLRARRHDMGAALYPAQPQEGEACDGAAEHVAPPTMADVIRERKKKAGGAALGTLRRRLVAAARRPRDSRPDRGCEHARFIRSVVSSWRLAEVFVLCEQLEAGAALRDLVTQAELAREPAPALHQDLAQAYRDRWVCDVELVGAGWSVSAHRAILAARCSYFRELLQRYPG
ncbi:BTB/POZ domain-containing protein 7 [Papilio xuthus]|nr:BTB/POZ domain-containing protein 7 [Papilio xuthus]